MQPERKAASVTPPTTEVQTMFLDCLCKLRLCCMQHALPQNFEVTENHSNELDDPWAYQQPSVVANSSCVKLMPCN